jgi:hypothetical protein
MENPKESFKHETATKISKMYIEIRWEQQVRKDVMQQKERMWKETEEQQQLWKNRQMETLSCKITSINVECGGKKNTPFLVDS